MRLYRFLTGPDDSTFCHKVTAALNKGWHLYGSPTYTYDKKNKSLRCGQAVVKGVIIVVAVLLQQRFARPTGRAT